MYVNMTPCIGSEGGHFVRVSDVVLFLLHSVSSSHKVELLAACVVSQVVLSATVYIY